MSDDLKKPETLAHNGAVIVPLLDDPFGGFGILDHEDTYCGTKRTLAEAREYAAKLPGSPRVPPPEPPQLARSERARARGYWGDGPVQRIDPGPQPDERPDLLADKSMSPWRRRNVGKPSER